MGDWRSYDGVAEVYGRIHAPRMAEPARDLVALAEPATDARVLDVGTGTGVAAAAAADAAHAGLSVGVDAAVGMLAVARRGRPDVPVAAARAIDLPFRDATFDVVLGAFVLTHVTKADTALFDLHRVLRTGGRIALSGWTGPDDELQRTWWGLVREVVPAEVLEQSIASAMPGRDRFRRREEVEEALIDAGFRHVRTEEREYRFRYALDEYVEGLGAWATGRFARDMLGDAGWNALLDRARTRFRERFADPVNDFRRVLLAVGTRV